MPRDTAFAEALSKISSDKIKDRAEGMASLRTIFQSNTSVENLSAVAENAGWLQTFQVLFGVVKMERAASLKKGKGPAGSSSSAAETRLSNAMNLVRWLVERSLTHLNKKVINALFSHLTQTIITSDGTLIRNAMDYIKALKMIMSYPPHLEHLGQGSWECLMSICWDAALGQRVEYSKEEWTGDLEPESSTEASESEEEQEFATPSVGTQKRKYASTMMCTLDRTRRSERAGPRLTTETTELISIIPILLSTPNAPILPPPHLPEEDRESDQPFARAGIRILRRTIKFLRAQPAETAAHRSILSALTIVLAELEVNAVQVMIEFAHKILALLLPLWHTKLKDQVILALRIILPFLPISQFICDAEPEEKHIERAVFSDLLALRDAISRSAPGKRSHILELPYLSLGLVSDPASSAARPMQTPLISATPDFTDPMIMSWATLELLADSLVLLHNHHEATSLRSTTPSATGSNKRQRIEEPVTELLRVMSSARYVEHRLSALQTMYFFILRHWGQVHDRLQVVIRETLQHLMVDPVPEVQQWADIDLAAICHVQVIADTPMIQPRTAAQAGSGRQEWLEIWYLALRKLIVTAGASSRSAALLLQVILKKQLLEPVLIITSIGKFLEAVNDQGPAAPYDAVCDFMVDCLDVAEQDARMHRKGFTVKVSEWFRTAWLAQEKMMVDAGDRANYEICSAWRLICRLSGLAGCYNLVNGGRPLIANSLFTRMQEEGHVVEIRDFILHAKLWPSEPEKHNTIGRTSESTKARIRPYSTSDARSLSRLFGLKLQQLDTTDADATNVARLRTKIDGCVLVLLVESGFIDSDPEHSQTNFESACDLLEKMLQIAFQKNWSLAERARLFAGLDAMFPQAGSASQGKHPEALLCVAGPTSGVLSVIMSNAGQKQSQVEHEAEMRFSEFHVKLWQKPKLNDMFRSRVRDFQQILQGEELHINSDILEPSVGEADDGFDAIKVDEEISVNTTQIDTNVTEAVVSSCLRCCFLPKYCANGMSAPMKDRVTMNILLAAEPSVFLQLCRPILQSIRVGVLEFHDDAMMSIYQVLQEFLGSYSYSRSSRMRRIAFDFVDTILSRLGPLNTDSFNTGSGELASIFLNWLGSNLLQGNLVFWEERMSVIRLFARIIHMDPGNESWIKREQAHEETDDPVMFLCSLVGDTDARVRFRLASMVAGLLHCLPNRDINMLYRDIQVHFPTRGFQVEYILSILIFQANVSIVNAEGRFNSLFHVYDTAYTRKFASGHVQVCLQSVVDALKLSGIADLYQQYAARLTLLQLRNDANPEELPMHLYGFTGRKQWAAAALASVGGVALLENKTWVWEHLSAMVGLSKEEGLQYIFSLTAGNFLAFEYDARTQRSGNQDRISLTQILGDFESRLAELGGKGKLHMDPIDTIASVVTMPGDASTTEEISALLRAQTDGADKSRVFDHIFPAESHRPLETVLVPVASAKACIRVMQWILAKGHDTPDKIIYNVTMQIMGKLHTKILVNERLRLVRNLAYFIAYHHRVFVDCQVLGFVLLRVGCVLAQHVDLVPMAANLITWILPHVKTIKEAEGEMVSIIAKLSAVALKWQNSTSIDGMPGIQQAGERIFAGLEHFIDMLWKSSSGNSRNRIFLPLLPIWPRALSKAPQQRLREMTRAELLDTAQNPAIHSQIFSLTLQLASKSEALTIEEIDTFSSRVFWHLKDSLSSGVQPSAEELSAFLEVCYSFGGRVRLIDSEAYSTLRTRSTLASAHKGKADATESMTEILFAMFERLNSSDLGTLHRAYDTLCIIGARLRSRISSAKLPTLLKHEMDLQRAHAPLQKSSQRTLFDVMKLDPAADISLALLTDTDSWASIFASAACVELARRDDLLIKAASLFEQDRRLSRQLLPQLVHLILDKEAVEQAGQQGEVCLALSGYVHRVLQTPEIPLATKTVILEIILYLRKQSRPGSYSHLDNDYWLDLDFSLIAKAALDCKMFATALLYWELYVDLDSKPDAENKQANTLNGHPVGRVHDEQDFQLLYDIYNNIDEPDGFYGIPLESNVKQSLLQRFQHESNWSLAFKYYGAELEARGQFPQHLPRLTRSLQSFGMDRLALLLFQSGENASQLDESLRLPYDLAWRTQSWDLPESAFLPDASDRSIYTALRTMHRSRDLAELQRVVEDIEREEIDSVKAFPFEDVHGSRKKMRELLSLREIKRWSFDYLPMLSCINGSTTEHQLIMEIPERLEPEMIEQILSVRLSLIRSAKSHEEWQLGDMLAERGRVLLQLERQCLRQLGDIARQRKNLDAAIRILAEQQSLTASDAADHVGEFAEVLWMQGDHALAIDQLKDTLGVSRQSLSQGKRSSQEVISPITQSKLLSRVGQWMTEAKQARPEYIYDAYFIKANALTEVPAAKPFREDRALIYTRFAGFADQEYSRLLQLSDLEQRHLVQEHLAVDSSEADLPPSSSRRGSAAPSARRSQSTQLGQLEGQFAFTEFEKIKRKYLQYAINMYARSMQYSDKYDDSIHRMCALWLENSSDDTLNDAIGHNLRRIPTSKFAFLASQLTARLDAEDVKSKFQPTLDALLKRLCEDHPFHIMYQVITLARPVQLSNKVLNSARQGKTPRGVNGRELAASNLLDQIRSIARRTAQVSDMERFASAAVEWCNVPATRSKKEFSVPANAQLATIHDLCIPVPTQELPFDKSGDYSPLNQGGPAFIQSYETKFTLAGGLHVPKIMNCLGHNGKRYKQLFKGHDDLRQDSVMEQVFTLVNTLLQRDEATASRELRFKTYIVLPLATETGIIEFVPDSIGVGEWLNPAHTRYRPNDLHPQQFRNAMKELQDPPHPKRPAPASELIRAFKDMRKQFKPVMRHFFTDMSNDPIGWYAMRLKYARSVAVGSMVGHLVGLGDRHGSNIMINTKTGEILHIDLGIAFDQGGDLAIPERVPFRLTNDMIDGLGSFGVEGVFKRCCEQTLRLLREKSDLILAVLEVFKHDPLQKWKADFEKVNQMQGGAAAKAHKVKMEAHASELATMALDRVRTKLLSNTSVEYTVNELIRTATDPTNLATIFYGWQPWM
ncbi:hypothetical protein NliqN6_0217 [Naganishia liquefaciens]|uniref:Serine/threonine-protein kinase Tel1 n=1 Tax=Naganishia liquefaciens TaxID=104408 RepID=A0A8H3YC19_9TREE|nr:hypothetical protein NliqN6_0217 [Naganishia liquefaciens]